jgi:hypothetical protein
VLARQSAAILRDDDSRPGGEGRIRRACVLLYLQRRLGAGDMALGCIDLLLGVLFLIAFHAAAVDSDEILASFEESPRERHSPALADRVS